MHYKNGRVAKNGDKVIFFPGWGAPVAGILYDAVAGNDNCNGKIAPTAPNDPCPNLAECLHVDDIVAANIPAPVAPEVQPIDAGKIAYDAYCESRDWKSVRGEPLPQFDAQSPELQAAWRAAGNAVIKIV